MATALVRGLFAYGQTFLGEWISQRVAYDIRNRIYDRLQRLSYAYHDQQQTGAVMSRATQDVEAVRMFVSMGLARGFYVLLLLVAVLILMVVTNWQLALVVWVFIPVIAWRSTVMAITLRPLWYKIQEGMARMATVLQEALSGARVVKAFAREEYESAKFRKEATALYESAYESSRVTAVNSPGDDRPLAGGHGGDAVGRRHPGLAREPGHRRADGVPAVPDRAAGAGARARLDHHDLGARQRRRPAHLRDPRRRVRRSGTSRTPSS